MPSIAKWETYKGKKYLFVNSANGKEQDMLAALEAAKQEILKLPRGSALLMLMDMSNTVPAASVNTKGRELTAAAKAHGIPECPTAIVGFSGVQRSITQMFISLRMVQNLRLFNHLEEAKDWLVTQ